MLAVRNAIAGSWVMLRKTQAPGRLAGLSALARQSLTA